MNEDFIAEELADGNVVFGGTEPIQDIAGQNFQEGSKVAEPVQRVYEIRNPHAEFLHGDSYPGVRPLERR